MGLGSWLAGRGWHDDIDEDAYDDDDYPDDGEDDDDVDDRLIEQGVPDDDGEHPSPSCPCRGCYMRWMIALHEAGHIAAYEALGLEWADAYIHVAGSDRSPDGTEGMVRKGYEVSAAGGELAAYMIGAFAGGAAEVYFEGESLNDGEDQQDIDDWLTDPTITMSAEEAQAAAEDIIADNEGFTLMVAHHLFHYGQMTSDEVMAYA